MVARARKRVKEALRTSESGAIARATARYTLKTMRVVVSLLRAVNVGGHAVIKMADLKSLYESLKFRDVHTYVQSGNVVFRTDTADLKTIGTKIQTAIEKRFKVRPGVLLRTTKDLRHIVAANPFAKRSDVLPAKLLVYFLNEELSRDSATELKKLPPNAEELIPAKRELYIFFPDGMGKSKLPWRAVEKLCIKLGTGRNWNTVTKLLAMAEMLESSK
jgi:uncharacterized protein (DUF1697 family)